jgi:riboflavin synthase
VSQPFLFIIEINEIDNPNEMSFYEASSTEGGMQRIGVVDTMFARVDMGALVLNALAGKPDHNQGFDTRRRTVPGFKDLAVAARFMIQREGCNIVIACGMPGAAELDRLCAHEAGMGLMLAQVLTMTPILEVFVHESEAGGDDAKLAEICAHRCAGHALNAYDMLFAPDSLIARAGQGVRQGGPDAGPLALASAK